MTEKNQNLRKPMDIIPPSILLEGYRTGIFPMADSRESEDITWYSARKRGIIPLDRFHISKRARRKIRTAGFDAGYNRSFAGVIDGCAGRETTWISDKIRRSFIRLHELGHAHSVEVFRGKKLAGGLYGVAIGGAFFAESMFQYEAEAMKAALSFCHAHLLERGYMLWDVQFYTEHLGQFGCVEIGAGLYEAVLKKALKVEASFG